MKINPTPFGILLGTVYSTRFAHKFSKVVNRNDYSLLKDIVAGWDEDSEIFNSRPILSTDLYYNYIQGNVEVLTAAGMFAEPEKSQVYLDILNKGCISADMRTLMLSTFKVAHSHKEALEIWLDKELHINPIARTIYDVFESLRELNKGLYQKLTTQDTYKTTTYVVVGERDAISKSYEVGVLNTTTLISSLGEVLLRCENYSGQGGKPKSLFIYVSPDADIHIMSDGRSTKQDIKRYLKQIIYDHANNLYKLILVKVLFNVLETSGDLFDFALQMSREQQCSVVKEGLWAGLVSSIKHPQDGSITDLLGCIANKVTYGSYYKGKLVNNNFSKLRSSVGPKGKHATE